MKALFLIQGFDVPSSRYRVLQFLPFWENAGHHSEVMEHGEALKNESDTLKKAQEADVVFIHRKRLKPSFVRKLKKTGARLVYDIDDAVMYRDATHGKAESFTRRWRYKRLVTAMNQVMVGNHYIAERTPVAAHIMPTCLTYERYQEAELLSECDQPTLVWIGDTGSLHYLEKMKNVFEKVGERVPNCRLKIICNRFIDLNNMQVDKVPWSAESEVKELADSQVGVMPLAMDPWSQGKCALKFLQYLAVGRPAVVTPAGMNNDVLARGACGLAAHHEKEWEDSLVTLLSDKEKRLSQGAQGREIVKAHYTVESRAADWVKWVSGQDL